MANGTTETEERGGAYGFLLPAGAMIGLGVGFLTGHVPSGVLIGVGTGLLASGLIPFVTRRFAGEGLRHEETHAMVPVIGAFLILVGIGLVLAPAVLWPYAIPGFLILFGLWHLARGFYRLF